MYKVKLKPICLISPIEGFIDPVELFKLAPEIFRKRTAIVDAVDFGEKTVYIKYDEKCYIIPDKWVQLMNSYDIRLFRNMELVK